MCVVGYDILDFQISFEFFSLSVGFGFIKLFSVVGAAARIYASFTRKTRRH